MHRRRQLVLLRVVVSLATIAALWSSTIATLALAQQPAPPSERVSRAQPPLQATLDGSPLIDPTGDPLEDPSPVPPPTSTPEPGTVIVDPTEAPAPTGTVVRWNRAAGHRAAGRNRRPRRAVRRRPRRSARRPRPRRRPRNRRPRRSARADRDPAASRDGPARATTASHAEPAARRQNYDHLRPDRGHGGLCLFAERGIARRSAARGERHAGAHRRRD